MICKLLTEHHLEFLSLKGAAEARMSLHWSKCDIVGNHMPWLILKTIFVVRPVSGCGYVAVRGSGFCHK